MKVFPFQQYGPQRRHFPFELQLDTGGPQTLYQSPVMFPQASTEIGNYHTNLPAHVALKGQLPCNPLDQSVIPVESTYWFHGDNAITVPYQIPSARSFPYYASEDQPSFLGDPFYEIYSSVYQPQEVLYNKSRCRVAPAVSLTSLATGKSVAVEDASIEFSGKEGNQKETKPFDK